MPRPGMSGPGILQPISPVALRLPGLQVSSRLRGGSPGKAFMPRPGMSGPGILQPISPLALRLPGLRGSSRLRATRLPSPGTTSAAKLARTDNTQNHAQRRGQHQQIAAK